MEYINLPPLPEKVSKIALGTRDCGKRSPKEIDEKVAFETLDRAIEMGVNFFSTAPLYGFTENEKLIGKFIKERKLNGKILINTKCGIRWRGESMPPERYRLCTKEAILDDCENSLRRLNIDSIDLYQIHWPDPLVSYEEMGRALELLKNQGKIKALGVSNFDVEMLEGLRHVVPIHAIESLYNMFERDIDQAVLPYCLKNDIAVISYRSLCGGLLTGNLAKFDDPNKAPYRRAVVKLQEWIQDTYHKPLGSLAVRWVLDRGVAIALWGAKNPSQLDLLPTLWDWKLTSKDLEEIETILSSTAPENTKLSFGTPPLVREIAKEKR